MPKIQVRFGSELLRDKIYKTSSLDEIVIHSPCDLKINIKNAVMKNYGTELIVPEFKSKFKPLFWNFIWYCKIHKLDYEIILPYLKDIQQLRQIKYQNRTKEIFEINYEDKNYADNLDKIKKYSKNIYDRFVNNKIKKKKIHKDNLNIVNEINLEFIQEKKLENISVGINNEEFKEKNEGEENSLDKEIEDDIGKEINQKIKLDKINSDIKNVIIEEKEEKEEIEENNENNNLDNQQNEEIGENYIDDSNKEQEEKEKEEEVKEVEKKEVQDVERPKKNIEEKEEVIEVEEMKPEILMFNEEENEVEEEEKNKINNEQEQEQEKEPEKEPEQEQEEQEQPLKETNMISEINNKKEEPKKEENKNNKINIENKFKNESKLMCNIKQSDLNIQLKKVMELRQSQREPDEININLKKLDKSLLVREPEAQKTINYKLKKIEVENLSQSTILNANKLLMCSLCSVWMV